MEEPESKRRRLDNGDDDGNTEARKNGEVEDDKENITPTTESEVVQAAPTIVRVDVELNGQMRGLTVLNDELFILPSKDFVVIAYDSYTFKIHRKISIPQMKDPRCLAGCSLIKSLFISDLELKCIHKINISSNKVECWKMNETDRPRGLSVTAENTVLVTVQVVNENQRKIGSKDQQIPDAIESKIVEYTTEGQLLREIDFDKSIDWAWQTFPMSKDSYITCHGGWGSSLHRICIVNAKGEITKSYGRESGRGEGQLNEPLSLAVDNRKTVFLADRDNDRVLMFNEDLILQNEVEAGGILLLPARIHYDSPTNRLFIDASSRTKLRIRGLTVADEMIFVGYDRRSYICIYDLYSLEAQRRINITNMKIPRDLAACSCKKILYISDPDIRSIHRVSYQANNIMHWKVENSSLPCGLSMSLDHHLLATLRTGDKRSESLIGVYTSEGQLLNYIKLDNSIDWVWQTIQLSKDQFAIYSGEDFGICRLCLVNSDGQVCKSLDQKKSIKEGNLKNKIKLENDFKTIALDKTNGYLYIPDANKDRILMYTTDLSFIDQVQTCHDLSKPSYLFFDSSTDRLFIGESLSGRVLIVNSVLSGDN